MPAATSPTTDQIAALQLGDEHALERVFRDQYPSLIGEALTVLGDAASAARTVESVFVRVWHERASFHTPAELETFLHETVHAAAVHKQSRNAVLHHHDATGGHAPKHAAHAPAPAPTIDEAWDQVASSIHTSAPTAEAIAHELADHSRHAAAVHVASIAKHPPWIVPVALGLVLLAFVYGMIRWMDRASAESAVTSALAAPDARALQTGAGQLADVPLEDGSTVRLGADSKMRVPPRFGSVVRTLTLDGAATFTVAPGRPLPFSVRARNAIITATGTVFSVRAYPGDDAVTVRVRDGQVTVRAGGDPRPLASGAALTVTKDGSMKEVPAPALAEAMAWTDGYMVVNDRPLRDVLPQFKRWYGLQLFVADTTLLNRPVTMRARLESSREAIAAIEASTGLRFGYEGTTMVLRDSSAAKDTKPAKNAKGAKGAKGAKPPR